MKRLVILVLVFATAQLMYAESCSVSVWVEHQVSLYTGSDQITFEVYPFSNEWAFGMSAPSLWEVTGPRIEFTSGRLFKDWNTYPTVFTPPSTYVWDYPHMSIPVGEDDIRIEIGEGGKLITSTFTATRTVDNTILTSDICEQSLAVMLRFVESPGYEPINGILVKLGTYPWDQTILEETVIWQNSVPGWLDCGDGTWWINPMDVYVGMDYNFQVRVRCIKNLEYRGVTIFHKPAVFIAMWQWNDLSEVVGPSISVIHPEGETVGFQVNESVNWQGFTTANKQEIFLRDVSVPVDGNGISADSITIFYGREYDDSGNYLDRTFETEVFGDNIVAAEVTMPTGRIWAMEIDDEGNAADLDFELLSLTNIRTLGVVSGLYRYSLRDHLGNTVSTVIDASLAVPMQPPHITYPAQEVDNVGQSITISWDAVWDSRIDTIYLSLEDDQEDWEFEIQLPPDQNSFFITGLPPETGIVCKIYFVNTQSGRTSEGIEWINRGYTLQTVHFTTCGIIGDFNGDCAVDFVDFAILALAWLTNSGDRGWNPSCDIAVPQDFIVDELDLDVFSSNWLAGK